MLGVQPSPSYFRLVFCTKIVP